MHPRPAKRRPFNYAPANLFGGGGLGCKQMRKISHRSRGHVLSKKTTKSIKQKNHQTQTRLYQGPGGHRSISTSGGDPGNHIAALDCARVRHFCGKCISLWPCDALFCCLKRKKIKHNKTRDQRFGSKPRGNPNPFCSATRKDDDTPGKNV